jgi:uncharacterized protein YgiM (DUF1202 family)
LGLFEHFFNHCFIVFSDQVLDVITTGKTVDILILFFVSLGVLLLSFCISYAAYARNLHQNSFVVTAHSANVHSAPTTNSTKLFVIHEGAAGEVLEEQPGWINARFPNGTKGWIPLDEIGKF